MTARCCRWARGRWPLPDPDEEEVPEEEEEWVDVEQAIVARCEEPTGANCRYLNGRVRARGGDTVADVARRLCLDDAKVAWLNAAQGPCLAPTSQLADGALLLLPVHPTVAQRMPGHSPVTLSGEQRVLPELANAEGSEAGGNNAATSPRARPSFEYLAACGRLSTRCAQRMPRLLYGGTAVRSGACEDWLGARVVVECHDARLLGTVACYEPGSSRYQILLDAHGASGGLGDVAMQPFALATPLPNFDVQVVAAMSAWIVPAEAPAGCDESPAAHEHAEDGGGMTPEMHPAESSHDASRMQPEQQASGGSALGAEQFASLVGMTVTRPFDGVPGTVSTLVPGSDVVIIEWEDGADSNPTPVQCLGAFCCVGGCVLCCGRGLVLPALSYLTLLYLTVPCFILAYLILPYLTIEAASLIQQRLAWCCYRCGAR